MPTPGNVCFLGLRAFAALSGGVSPDGLNTPVATMAVILRGWIGSRGARAPRSCKVTQGASSIVDNQSRLCEEQNALANPLPTRAGPTGNEDAWTTCRRRGRPTWDGCVEAIALGSLGCAAGPPSSIAVVPFSRWRHRSDLVKPVFSSLVQPLQPGRLSPHERPSLEVRRWACAGRLEAVVWRRRLPVQNAASAAAPMQCGAACA